jgi:two-component system chemotaxis response regulator CheY
MKSLIADDDDLVRKVLQKRLNRFGLCHAVADGTLAVQAFEQALQDEAPYDLICLDIIMPHMDGQGALRRIRELEKCKGIRACHEAKVLMLTGLDDPHSVIEAFYQGGASSYLVKPLDWHRVQEELQQMGLLTADDIVHHGPKDHASES